MSETEAKFRIRKGEVEIEYAGKQSDVNERFEKAFKWVTERSVAHPNNKVTFEAKAKKENEKPDKRGGIRSNIISKAIDDDVSRGWFDSPKKAADVLDELQRRAIPGVALNNINEALKRRAKSGVLDRIKGKDKQWTYVAKSSKG